MSQARRRATVPEAGLRTPDTRPLTPMLVKAEILCFWATVFTYALAFALHLFSFVRGRYRGLDSSGGLILESDGSRRVYHAGEVSLRAGDAS